MPCDEFPAAAHLVCDEDQQLTAEALEAARIAVNKQPGVDDVWSSGVEWWKVWKVWDGKADVMEEAQYIYIYIFIYIYIYVCVCVRHIFLVSIHYMIKYIHLSDIYIYINM